MLAAETSGFQCSDPMAKKYQKGGGRVRAKQKAAKEVTVRAWCLWEYQVSDGVCLGCVLWVWKVKWVPRHALVAIERSVCLGIHGLRGGGGARGGCGGDHAGVCPRGGIGLIPSGGAILQSQRCHSRSGKP